MRELVLTPKFERTFRRLVGKNPALQPQIEIALRRMAENINDPRLKTHHLSGKLVGLFTPAPPLTIGALCFETESSENRRGSSALGQHRLT